MDVLEQACRAAAKREENSIVRSQLDDAPSKIMLRLMMTDLASLKKATTYPSLTAWARGAVRHHCQRLRRDVLRHHQVAWSAVQAGVLSAEGVSLLAIEGRFEELLANLRTLPPPYRQVARLQLLCCWRRDEVSRYLQRWRPSVGLEETRRLMRETHRLIRAMVRDPDLLKHLPCRFSKKNNRWNTTPPPIPGNYPL